MSQSKKIIASECFEAVMDAVSKEVKKITDNPPENVDREAFLTYFNTLINVVDVVFDYLPGGEKASLKNLCATWMDVGILLGKSPQLLTEILEKTDAKLNDKEPGGAGDGR